MAREGSSAATRVRQPAPEPPVDADADDLEDPADWEVLADSETDGPMGLIVEVTIESDYVPAVARVAHREGVDVETLVQRRVREWGHALQREEQRGSPGGQP